MVWTWTVVGIFGVWAVLSVLNQFPRVRKDAGFFSSRIKSRDYLSLIPLWTFFAPTPGTHDHEVLFRDRLVDGRTTAWRQVSAIEVPWLCGLWNPGKRTKKAHLDLTVFLAQHAILAMNSKEEGAAKSVFVSLPYIGIATRVGSAPRGPLTAQRQFMVAMSNGYQHPVEAEIVFISPFFSLG